MDIIALSRTMRVGVCLLLAGIAALILGFKHESRADALSWLERPALDLRPRYSLTDQNGRPVSDAALRGAPVLVTFGGTACGEPCRDALRDDAEALDALGPDAKVAFLFVTLDPAHDDPERLAAYVAKIDPRLRGLGGTGASVAAAAEAFRFVRPSVPGGPAATMTYLLDAEGRLRQILPNGIGPDAIAAMLRPLMG